MAQKTTYSTARRTKADDIAEAERAKEEARIARAEEQATLQAIADNEIMQTAADIVRERMEKGNGAPVDTKALAEAAEERLAQREADEALYDVVLKERDKSLKNFYRFAKAANNAALKFTELAADMSEVCTRLGKPNPIRVGPMGVSDGVGVITDPLRHTEEIWERFAKLYRLESGTIDQDTWEKLP